MNTTLAGLMEGKGQVMLDVRIYEIGKTHAQNIEVHCRSKRLSSTYQPGAEGTVRESEPGKPDHQQRTGEAGDYTTIAAILIASGAITGNIDRTLYCFWWRHDAGGPIAWAYDGEPEPEHIRIADAGSGAAACRRSGGFDAAVGNTLPDYVLDLSAQDVGEQHTGINSPGVRYAQEPGH